MKKKLCIILLALSLAGKINAQNFDPEKYKTDRDRQKSIELQRESERRKYEESQRKSSFPDKPAKVKNYEKIQFDRSDNNKKEEEKPYVAPPKVIYSPVLTSVQPTVKVPIIKLQTPLTPKPGTEPDATGIVLYKFPNGDTYEGTWQNKQMDKGTYKFANGQKFVGYFKDNKMYGKFSDYWFNKTDKLTNYFPDSQYEYVDYYFFYIGLGTNNCILISCPKKYFNNNNPTYIKHYSFGNGDSYEGEFLNGKMHGHGTYRLKNGAQYEGTFSNGKIVSVVLKN